MQIILSGLHGDATESSVAEGLAPFFHVRKVEMIREGAPDSPWALIDLDDSYGKVWEVCNELRGVFHRGKRLHFYIPLHQPDLCEALAPHERIDIR